MPLDNLEGTDQFDSVETKLDAAITKINELETSLGEVEEDIEEINNGLISSFNKEADIQTGTSTYVTISSETYATLSNGSGTTLAITLPNDSVERTLLIIGIAAYENGSGQVSIIRTRIYNGSSTLKEAYTDLRGDQDDVVIQKQITVTCTGQTISLQARIDNAAIQDSFGFNGGSLTVNDIT